MILIPFKMCDLVTDLHTEKNQPWHSLFHVTDMEPTPRPLSEVTPQSRITVFRMVRGHSTDCCTRIRPISIGGPEP